MANTYVVGDIHGRLDLLEKTLQLIEEDAGDEGGTFICLGDFIDRGPNSNEVIDLLKGGPANPKWRWIILQGNHEAMMLEVLNDPYPGLLQWWIGNGGGETLKSYGYEQGDKLLPLKQKIVKDLGWLTTLPFYHEDKLRIYVHAGVIHDKPVQETKAEILQWILYRDIVDAPHMSGKHVVHGHHQSSNHPLLLPHRTNLDSFAWYTGRLAIGVFNDTQAEPVKILEALGQSNAY